MEDMYQEWLKKGTMAQEGGDECQNGIFAMEYEFHRQKELDTLITVLFRNSGICSVVHDGFIFVRLRYERKDKARILDLFNQVRKYLGCECLFQNSAPRLKWAEAKEMMKECTGVIKERLSYVMAQLAKGIAVKLRQCSADEKKRQALCYLDSIHVECEAATFGLDTLIAGMMRAEAGTLTYDMFQALFKRNHLAALLFDERDTIDEWSDCIKEKIRHFRETYDPSKAGPKRRKSRDPFQPFDYLKVVDELWSADAIAAINDGLRAERASRPHVVAREDFAAFIGYATMRILGKDRFARENPKRIGEVGRDAACRFIRASKRLKRGFNGNKFAVILAETLDKHVFKVVREPGKKLTRKLELDWNHPDFGR